MVKRPTFLALYCKTNCVNVFNFAICLCTFGLETLVKKEVLTEIFMQLLPSVLYFSREEVNVRELDEGF